ncbi:MAG: hypothetical protein P8X96_08080 [Desulfobacteraceae bacterium]|jgi:hypothetical protein
MKKSGKTKQRRPIHLVLALVLAATAAGCSWSGPHLQHNSAVASHFDSYEIYPQYQYYTAGTLQDPRAILALKPGFALESPGWQPVDMTPELLSQWIAAFKEDYFADGNVFSDGANVVGQNGEVAGHFYSIWEFPVVRIPKEMTIALAVPAAEYRPYNEKVIDFWADDHDDYGFSH